MKNSRICVLASGGLDSVALIGHLCIKHHVLYPVYIRQGLAWENKELDALRRFLRLLKKQKNIRPLTVLNLPMKDVYGRHWSLGEKPVPGARTPDKAVYLPGRNPILSVKAAVFCALHNISEMALGSLHHNPFPDASPTFFAQWSRVLSRALGKPLRISAPFRTLSKAQVIRRAAQWPLHVSFSCLAPQGRRHCGRCNKCAERKAAFHKARVSDQTSYAH